jgi:hypothetical protein
MLQVQPHYGPGADSASNRNECQESPWGKGRPARKADNLTDICEPNVYKMWQHRRLTTLWASMACYRDSSTFSRYKFYCSVPEKGSQEISELRTKEHIILSKTQEQVY